MEMLLVCVLITWVVMRLGGTVKGEWQHSRDTHAAKVARDYPEWSPGRIRRNARRRARGDWWTELRDGFPTLKATLAEDRVLARTVREEKLAAGEERIRHLRERLAAAVEKREALRKAGEAKPRRRVTPEPEDATVEPGTVPDAKPGRHAKPEPGAEPAPGTGDAYDPDLDTVVHHDHTYMLPGQCPQCHGPGPGIPLVRGDHVKEVRAPGGTLIGSDGTVVSADDKTATVELPNGLRVTGPNVAVPVAHRNGDSPDEAPIDDAVTGADREFADWPDDGWPDSPEGQAARKENLRAWDEAAEEERSGRRYWPDGTGLGGSQDDDAIPNPPSDETTDDTTEKEAEGDTMTTEIDSADTPYQGMQNAFQGFADQAAKIAHDAGDNLQAQVFSHGFDRDPQVMRDVQELADAAHAVVAKATAAKACLIDRHNAAEEYHGTGQDAHASAFRPV